MDNNLVDSILSVCRILNKHSVQYIIVGGIAVALHGYFRLSLNVAGLPADKPDLDFWYNPTYDNYFRLLNALEELGQDVAEFKKEITPNPKKSFFKFDLDRFTMDFLPELKKLSRFKSSFDKRVVVTFKGVDISFINYDDLIKDKEANYRPKDLIDIEQLKAKRNKKL